MIQTFLKTSTQLPLPILYVTRTTKTLSFPCTALNYKISWLKISNVTFCFISVTFRLTSLPGEFHTMFPWNPTLKWWSPDTEEKGHQMYPRSAEKKLGKNKERSFPKTWKCFILPQSSNWLLHGIIFDFSIGNVSVGMDACMSSHYALSHSMERRNFKWRKNYWGNSS